MTQQWPLQSQCDSFYGNPRGKNGSSSVAWEKANLTLVRPPFRTTFAGDPIKGVRVHKKCADSLFCVFAKIWELSGHDQKKIDAWGVSIYGGAYNFRVMRGGSSLSMHSWGCAIDLDPARNGFHDQHGHFHDSSIPIVAAFEAEGWTWGGRWEGRSCDPMHFQAARVR